MGVEQSLLCVRRGVPVVVVAFGSCPDPPPHAAADVVAEPSSGLAREGWPLVGRDAVVARLVSAARRGLRGAPGVGGVVVAGAAGTGKTRVALEVASQVGAVTGCDVARVIATASGATIPLGALAPLLPSDGAPEEVGADALLLAADAIAIGGPRLLVVDDLHQLDAASATVVLQLVTGRRLFLVGTLRTDLRVAVW